MFYVSSEKIKEIHNSFLVFFFFPYKRQHTICTALAFRCCFTVFLGNHPPLVMHRASSSYSVAAQGEFSRLLRAGYKHSSLKLKLEKLTDKSYLLVCRAPWQNPTDRRAQAAGSRFLTGLEARGPRRGVSPRWFPVRLLSQACRWPPCCVVTWSLLYAKGDGGGGRSIFLFHEEPLPVWLRPHP